MALVKFKTPVDLSLPHIRTICLPKDDKTTYTGREATVTGWGMTTYNGATSNVLRAVNIIYDYINYNINNITNLTWLILFYILIHFEILGQRNDNIQ